MFFENYKKRNSNIEILRIIAMFFVIFHHAISQGFSFYSMPESGINTYFYQSFNCLGLDWKYVFYYDFWILFISVKIFIKKSCFNLASVIFLFFRNFCFFVFVQNRYLWYYRRWFSFNTAC